MNRHWVALLQRVCSLPTTRQMNARVCVCVCVFSRRVWRSLSSPKRSPATTNSTCYCLPLLSFTYPSTSFLRSFIRAVCGWQENNWKCFDVAASVLNWDELRVNYWNEFVFPSSHLVRGSAVIFCSWWWWRRWWWWWWWWWYPDLVWGTATHSVCYSEM